MAGPGNGAGRLWKKTMRTAITIGYTEKGGWQLLSGPDVPVDQQLQAFHNLAKNAPKELLKVQFQAKDGKSKHWDRNASATAAAAMKQAEAKAEEKRRISERGVAAQKKAQADALKADEEKRAREVAAKEAEKARLKKEAEAATVPAPKK